MGILDRAELLLQARNYSGSGAWLDESGNGHDAQLGSTSGADSNDPVFKAYDGTQYLYLPGVAGNYVDTADVNLLDADTAHLQQSDGLWDVIFGLSKSFEAYTGSPIGDNALKLTMSNTSTSVVRTNKTVVPVSAATEYSYGVWLGHVDDMQVILTVDQYDGGGVFIAGATLSGTNTAVTESGWLWLTATSHASAASWDIKVQFLSSGIGHSADDIVWLGAACLRAGSDATFVPSIRIVGDSEIEFDASAPDWTPASSMTILDANTGNDGMQWLILITGTSYSLNGDGASNRLDITPALGLTDGERYTLKMTNDLSTGVRSIYIDGALFDATASLGTNPATYQSGALTVGATGTGSSPFSGNIYSFTLRDGIDGPIVAKYDATEAVEPFATQTDSETGRTWSYKRSASGYVATVVDRDMFLLSTDDYFDVPDADGLDFDAGEDMTMFAVIRGNGGLGTNLNVISKRNAVNEGYSIAGFTGNTVAAVWENTTGTTISDVSTATVAGETIAVLASRTNDTANRHEVFVDGVGTGSPGNASRGDMRSSVPFRIGAGATGGGYLEGQIVAVALFREALTDQEIADVGAALTASYDVSEAVLLHGDALWDWMLAQPGVVALLSTTDTELVGALNELNGTDDVEYAEARGTFLGVDPAG